jgi:hypothetical protein
VPFTTAGVAIRAGSLLVHSIDRRGTLDMSRNVSQLL